MFETIAILLLVLWALGLVTSYTLGGFIHVLLLLALIVIAIRIIQGRRVV
ncbi:MAG TPA: lmo0937 family membrane protein [Steroidobacteraceae bacterium]|nr:lmo0937 family membrane protein [Steroidobacteraceae bacterium]